MVYVQAEFRPWVRMFLDEFFGEIYRLHGWECRPGTSKRTPHVGKLIKHSIYEHLPEGSWRSWSGSIPRTMGSSAAQAASAFDRHHRKCSSRQADFNRHNVHADRAERMEFDELFERAFPPPQSKLPLIIKIPGTEGAPCVPEGRPARPYPSFGRRQHDAREQQGRGRAGAGPPSGREPLPALGRQGQSGTTSCTRSRNGWATQWQLSAAARTGIPSGRRNQ
jgi:P63C domain